MSIRKILIVAFVLRFSWLLLVGFGAGEFWTQDSSGYAALAKNLYHHGEFTQGEAPETYRTPGYPLFITLGMALGDLTYGTLLLQVLLSTASVYGVYLLCFRIFENKKMARWAALIFSFEPLSIIYCSFLLSETLFQFMIIWFLERFYFFIKEKNIQALTVAALCLAAAIFVKPIALYIPRVLIVLFLLVLARPQWFTVFVSGLRLNSEKLWTKKTVYVSFALFTLITITSTSLWTLRNKVVANHNSFYQLNSMFLDFQAAATLSKLKKKSVEDSWEELRQLYIDHPNAGPQVLKENPFIFLGVYSQGWLKNLGDPGSVDAAKQLGQYPKVGGLSSKMIEEGIPAVLVFLISHRPVLFSCTIVLGLMLLGCYFWALKGLRYHFYLLLPLFLLFLYFLILSGGSNALARYRFPLMPFLSIFAAVGLFQRWGDRIEE